MRKTSIKLWPKMETKKKSCRYCKAYPVIGFHELLPELCELEYPVAHMGSPMPNRHIAIPLKCCPKPTTYKDYFEAVKWYKFKAEHSLTTDVPDTSCG